MNEIGSVSVGISVGVLVLVISAIVLLLVGIVAIRMYVRRNDVTRED